MSVAFLSWPINHPLDWLTLLKRADRVVFLGLAADGSMCASESFWGAMRDRQLQDVCTGLPNDMLVWGRKLEKPRQEDELHLVEKAGLDMSRIYYRSRS